MDLKSAFGFHTTPFTREIKADQLFLSPTSKEATDGTVGAIEKRMCAAVIGGAGTGKTTVGRAVCHQLPEARYRTRYVKVSSLGKRDLCREIARACGVEPAGTFPGLVHKLQERFERGVEETGQRPVILIDDAHELRPDVIGILRILTNFQMDSRLVVSIVLLGQPPLAALLGRDDHEDVARRIANYAHLRTLSRDETQAYIEHRSTLAGARQLPFDTAAIDAIFEMSRGNLRAIDALALRSLEIAAALKLQVVSAQHITSARRQLWPTP